MKTHPTWTKWLVAVAGVIVLPALTAPTGRAELIIAEDFPINGVNASNFAPDARGAFLLAAFEKDFAS